MLSIRLPQKNLTFSQLFLGDPGISLSWILLELRFLALRFKFLIQGILRFAKASHPSHFGLRPACYTKSALLKFLAARSLNFASKFLFQEIFLLHSSLALAGFAHLCSLHPTEFRKKSPRKKNLG